MRTVVHLSTRLWLRDTARSIGIGTRAVVVSVVVFVVLVAATSVLAYVLLDDVLGPQQAAGGDSRALFRFALAGTALTAAMYQVILSASLPPGTALDTLCRLLPVSSRVVAVGLTGPVLVAGTALGCLTSVGALPLLSRLVDGGGPHAAGAVAWVVVVTVGLVAGAFAGVRWLAQRMRVPDSYGLGFASISALGLVAAMSLPALVLDGRSDPGVLSALPLWALADAAASGSDADTFRARGLVGAWSLVALGAAVLASRATFRTSRTRWTRFGVGAPVPTGRFAGQVWLEAASLARLPQTAVVTMLVLALGVLAPFAAGTSVPPAVAQNVLSAGLVLPWGLAAYAHGALRGALWLRIQITGRRTAWVFPRLVATFAVSGVLWSLYVLGLLLLGHDAGVVLTASLAGLALWGVANLCGTLVPFSSEQPLSATVTTGTTGAAWAALSIVVAWLLGKAGADASWLPALVVAALAVLGFVLVGRQREIGLVRHQ